MKVNIVGISGSPRKGSTRYCVQEALKAASEIEGVETRFIDLRAKKIHYCIHCDCCIKEHVTHCPAFDDDMTDFYETMLWADGIIMGSPVYQMSATGLIYNFINRLRPIAGQIVKGHWASRVGGSIAVGGTRHGGQETTLESLNNFFFCTGLTVVSGGIFGYNGGSVWSNDKKEQGAMDDETGMATVRVVGRKVAITAKMLKAGLESFTVKPDPGVLVGLSNQDELIERLKKFSNR